MPPDVLKLWDAVELLSGVPKLKLDNSPDPVVEEGSRPLIHRESVKHLCVRIRARLCRRRAGLDPHPKLGSAHRLILFTLRHVQCDVLGVKEGKDGHIWLVREWTRPEHVEQPWVVRVASLLRSGTEYSRVWFG